MKIHSTQTNSGKTDRHLAELEAGRHHGYFATKWPQGPSVVEALDIAGTSYIPPSQPVVAAMPGSPSILCISGAAPVAVHYSWLVKTRTE